MLRSNVLAVMCIGLLMACGTKEPGEGEGRSAEAVGKVRAALTSSPSSLTFPATKRGTRSTLLPVRLEEPSSGAASQTCTLSIATGEPFLFLEEAGTYGRGPATFNPISKGAFIDVSVVFEPSVVGAPAVGAPAGTPNTGTLNISCKPPGNGSTPTEHPVSLSGEGTSSATRSPAGLTFEDQKTGTVSQEKTVELSNSSTAFNITSISATGDFVPSTPLTTSDPAVPVPGGSVAVPGKKTIGVKYQPTTNGSLNGTLTITTDEPSSFTVNLTGSKVASATQVTLPSSLDFGDQRVGTTSGSKKVTVRNAGQDPLTITFPVTTPFALVPPPLGMTVARGESRELEVTFHPTAPGLVSGNFTLTTNETNPSVSVPVNFSGKGVRPNVVVLKGTTELSGNTVAFGDVRLQTPKTETVTLKNTGTASISFTDIIKGGSNSAAFTYTVAPEGTVFMLAPQQTRTLTLTYTPTVETTNNSQDTATLTFVTDDSTYPNDFVVDLNGKGVRPNVVLLSGGTPLSSNSIAFNGVRLTTDKVETVTLKNTGTGSIDFTNITPAGSPTFSYTINPTGTSFTLAPNAERTLSVTYRPTTETVNGSQDTGSLTFATLDPTYTSTGFVVGLSGKGVRPNVVLSGTSVTGSSLAFGEQPLNADRTETVTVRNNGTGPISFSSVAKTGPNQDVFTHTVNPAGTSFTLEPNTERALLVTYRPTTKSTNGSQDTAAITFATQDPTYQSGVVVNLSGKGITPALVLTPTPIAFDGVRVGTSVTKTVRLRNDGSGTLYITNITKESGSHAAFSPVQPASMPITLTPGAETELSVTYSPTAETTTPSPDTGTLVVTGASNLGITWTTARATLTGRGVRPNVVLLKDTTPVAGNAVAFGEVRLTTSKTETVTLKNTGSGPITFSNTTQVSNSQVFSYVIDPAGASFTLEPNATRTLTLTYSPTTETSNGSQDTGTLTFATTDAAYAPTGFVVSFSGKGVRPNVVLLGDGTLLNGNPLAFGDVRVGTSTTKTLTVRNTGTGPITFSNPSTGTGSAFSLVGAPASFTVNAGAEQPLTVRFSPTQDASATGSLTLTSNDPSYMPPSGIVVSLTGNGVVPNLALSGSALTDNTLAFGERRVGTERTEVITVRNNGTGPITFSSLSTSGAPFTLVNPPATLTVGANSQQTVSVKFSPTADASATGTLTLATSDATYTPGLTLTLTGRGVQPNVVLLSGTTPLNGNTVAFGNVRVGTTPTQTVKVRNNGTGPITFSSINKTGNAYFSLVGAPTSFTVQANSEQLLTVQYSPTAVSTTTDTGSLTLVTSDSAYTPGITLSLTGKGVKPILTLEPSPELAFGDVRVGTSLTKPLTVRNSGSGPILITELVQSANATFTLVDAQPSFTVQPGTITVLSVKFSPATETTESATLTFATNDPDYPSGVAVNLTGKGVKPTLVVTPATELPFGDVRVGTSVTQTVTLSNTGTGPIVFSNVATSGAPFTLVNATTPLTVGANSQQTLTVRFSPTEDAAASGTLTLTTNDPAFPSGVAINLTGRGVRPNLVLVPATELPFGDVPVGGTRTQTVTVRNTGTGPITISSLSLLTSAPFTLVNPPTSFTLQSNTELGLTVRFSPTVDATASDTLTLTTLDSQLPSATLTLSGRGVKANLVLSPSQIQFGDVRVGTSLTQTVRVRNTGTGAITVSSITKGGHPAFELVAAPASFEVLPGGERILSVKYSPTAETTTAAPDTGLLTLFTNDPSLPRVTGDLTGRGVKPVLVLDPVTEIALGEVRVDTEKTATLTLRNTGTGPITFTSVATSGAPFTLVNPPVGSFTVEAGTNNTRVLTVKFSPTADAPATGTLTLISNDPDYASGIYASGITVNLSGRGVKPRLELDPATELAFGRQIVGTTSTARTVKVRNTGTGPVRITDITAPLPFAVVSTKAFDLPAGQGADINVTFSPTAKTDFTARLTLFTNEAIPSATPIDLKGTGISSLRANPAAVVDFGDVASGQEATSTITLTNESDVAIANLAVSTVASPFSVTPPQATTLSTRGAATTFTVKFRPVVTSEQEFSGSVTLTSDASNSPQVFTLVGKGVVPTAKLSRPADTTAAPIAALDFGGVRVNATTQLPVRLTNAGKAPLTLTKRPTLSSNTDGGTSVFSYLGPDTITIAPNSYIDFQVSFQPAAKIIYSDSLTIWSNASNNPTVLSLTGSGADPEVSLDRTSIFFGDVRVGSRSPGVPITINNTGNAPVSLQNLPVAGAFEVVLPRETDGGTILLPRTIPIRDSFTFSAIYRPTTEATENGSVSIVTDMRDTDAGTLMVTLSGTGTTSRLGMSASALNFGGQRVLKSSGVLPVVVSNPGKAELEITQLIFSNSMFDIAVSETLPRPTENAPLRVGAGQQKAIPLIFTPSTLGQAQGQLFVISNAANVTDAGTLSLSGKGIDGQITLTPSVVSFDSDGGVEVGGAGAQQTVKLTNSGEATLTITRMEAPTSGGFTVSGLPTQDDAGLTLQPNGEWPLTVTFTPENRGFISTSAIIRSDSVMNPVYSMALRGTGVAAALELQPKDVYFGKSNVGVPTSQNLSIKNEGERDLYVSNIAFVDVDGGTTDAGTTSAALDFSIGSTGGDGGTTVGFPLVVGPKESRLVPVNFTPRQTGPRQARALVFTNDKLAEANLSGEGVSPNLAVSSLALVRGALDFGSVVMNKPSTARVLKLTNTGEGRLTVSTLTLGGADAASFILTPPTLPITLQPGAFTEVSVSLTPNAERQFSAQLVIASNDPETPSMTVPLVGIGVRQQIGLSKNSLEFGQQLISHTSNARSLLVRNSSDTDVTLSALAVEGTGASQFTLLQPLGVPLVLTPGQEQKVELTFTPQADADVNCVLKISFGDLTLNVALRGKGIPAVLSIAPSPLDFGGVRIGSGVRENPLTITNVSSDPIVLAAPEVTYKTGEPFTYDAAGLQGRELAPGMSIIISVGYQPEEETLSETTLSFGTTTPAKPRSVDVQLKGTATSRLLFVDQESWDFGFVKVDKQVESKVFTITNKSAQKQRAVVKMRDSQGAPFILGTKELANGIAPGGTATFSVDFDPDQAGVVKDELQVWLQGATEAEALIPVQGQGTDIKSVPPSGCSASTTEAGTAGLLALLALVGLGSRRRRRE